MAQFPVANILLASLLLGFVILNSKTNAQFQYGGGMLAEGPQMEGLLEDYGRVGDYPFESLAKRAPLDRSAMARFGKRAPLDRSALARFGKRAPLDRSAIARFGK
nr:FMRFamide-related peptide precursor [Heterodera glycines]